MRFNHIHLMAKSNKDLSVQNYVKQYKKCFKKEVLQAKIMANENFCLQKKIQRPLGPL